MAIIDYSAAFDHAWSPLDTYGRGQVGIAQYNRQQRDRAAEEDRRNAFYLDLEKAREDRQVTAIKAMRLADEERKDHELLKAATAEAERLDLVVPKGATLGQIKSLITHAVEAKEDTETLNAYDSYKNKIESNNKAAGQMMSRFGPEQQRAAAATFLASGTKVQGMTPDQRERLQAWVTPGIKRKNGTTIPPATPDQIRTELGGKQWFTEGNPDTRVASWGSAFGAALHEQTGKDNPNIVELQNILDDNRKLIALADPLLGHRAVAKRDKARLLEARTEAVAATPTGHDAEVLNWANQKKATVAPPAPVVPVSSTDEAAAPIDYTLPFGAASLNAASDFMRTPTGQGVLGAVRGLAYAPEKFASAAITKLSPLAAQDTARIAAVPGAIPSWLIDKPLHGIAGVVDQPMINALEPGFDFSPAPELTRPVQLSPEDMKGLGDMVMKEMGPAQLKPFMDAVRNHDPAALRQAREFHDRYLAMKAGMGSSGGVTSYRVQGPDPSYAPDPNPEDVFPR